MLSREDHHMIKQLRRQGCHIVDIAHQVGCSDNLGYITPKIAFDLTISDRTDHQIEASEQGFCNLTGAIGRQPISQSVPMLIIVTGKGCNPLRSQ